MLKILGSKQAVFGVDGGFGKNIFFFLCYLFKIDLLSMASLTRTDSSCIYITPPAAMKRECLPIESLPVWLRLNGVSFNGVVVQRLESDELGMDKGFGLVATEEKTSSDDDTALAILIQVPLDLVLSMESVQNYAKSDHSLREVLDAVGDFGTVCARGCHTFQLLD